MGLIELDKCGAEDLPQVLQSLAAKLWPDSWDIPEILGLSRCNSVETADTMTITQFQQGRIAHEAGRMLCYNVMRSELDLADALPPSVQADIVGTAYAEWEPEPGERIFQKDSTHYTFLLDKKGLDVASWRTYVASADLSVGEPYDIAPDYQMFEGQVLPLDTVTYLEHTSPSRGIYVVMHPPVTAGERESKQQPDDAFSAIIDGFQPETSEVDYYAERLLAALAVFGSTFGAVQG